MKCGELMSKNDEKIELRRDEMLEVKFYSVASSKETIIKQLKHAVDTLEKGLILKKRDEQWVSLDFGKSGLSVKKIKWGAKQLFEELWPEKDKK